MRLGARGWRLTRDICKTQNQPFVPLESPLLPPVLTQSNNAYVLFQLLPPANGFELGLLFELDRFPHESLGNPR
jgi:hypothetical protein